MAKKTRRKKQVTPERLMELSFAYAPPLIISAGVSNQVFDSLEDGAKTPEQVAEKTGASARALRILMNALVGLDLLKKDRQGKYSLTPESAAFLLSKNPGTHAGFFGTIAPQIISRWLRLSDIVREGRPAVAVNQETEGTEFFSQLVENIIPMSYPPAQKLADHLKVAKTKNEIRVLDLAAGSGIWGIALAQKSPRAAGDGSRLGRNDSDDKTNYTKVRRRRSLQLCRRRYIGGQFRQRLRHRDSRSHFAQRRRRTQSRVAQENFSRPKIRRHDRYCRMAGE